MTAPALEAAPVAAVERRALLGLPGMVLGAAAGGAAALAQPPFGVIPGLLGFALLLHLLDGASGARPLRSAFARAWAAGAAYFFVSTWWIGEAFLVDIAVHGWQAPFAVGLLAGGLGLLWGAAGVLYRLIALPGPRRVLTFAAVFALFEWLRGNILTGFPWDLPGEAWRAGSPVSQAASWLGAYGLSIITLAIAAAPAVLLGRDGPRARVATVAGAALALAVLWGAGATRLAGPGAHAPDTPYRVRVVQPDIDQAAKWDAAAFRDIFARYVRLTAQPGRGRAPDAVIWPESAIPADIDDFMAPGTWTLAALEGATQPGQTLLIGAQRAGMGPVDTGAETRYYNSFIALRRTPDGFRQLAVYDKHHLVPFGEYLPFAPLMTAIGFRALAHIPSDFSPGPSPRPIQPDGVPAVQPLICFETLFPGIVGDYGGRRPAWIANVSNDAWFGKTSGPWQHLNLASYRAIEEGLPILRATPTGISAVVDAYGRPRATLGQGVQGVIDADLPYAAPPTLYERWREGPFWLLVCVGFATAWRRRAAETNRQSLEKGSDRVDQAERKSSPPGGAR